jgi:hypothetical protein
MSMTQPSYALGHCSGRCAATGREFNPGEVFVASLFESLPGRRLERADYSLQAWEGGARPGPANALFGFWRATYSPAPEKKSPLLSDPELLDLFEELQGAAEHKQVVFRYVLALLLVRRRVLRLMGSPPGRLLVLPRGEAGQPREVVDPGMDEAAVGEAIEQLSQVVAVEAGGPGRG